MGLTLMRHDFATALGLRNTKGGSRAPTTPSKTFGEGAGNESVDMVQVQEWMQLSTQVYQNAETAVNVLSDLLNYDKIQMGTLTLELSLVSIMHLLEKTVNEFRIAARESKVDLDLDLLRLIGEDGKTPDAESGTLTIQQLPADIRDVKVVADHVRLAQVFRNLLSNGLKFSNEGGTYNQRLTYANQD
jgi:signal transduction histidine kinase